MEQITSLTVRVSSQAPGVGLSTHRGLRKKRTFLKRASLGDQNSASHGMPLVLPTGTPGRRGLLAGLQRP